MTDELDTMPIQCPKCNGRMESVTYSDIKVERCTGCHGMFFDSLETTKLAPVSGSDEIDKGAVSRGTQMNQQTKINCPKCHTRMVHQRDTDQRHIELESCPSCFGVFLDAGEFKDMKDHTLVESVKEWFARVRG